MYWERSPEVQLRTRKSISGSLLSVSQARRGAGLHCRLAQKCVFAGLQQNFFGSHAVKGMAMSHLYLVGRILFALIFITFGA